MQAAEMHAEHVALGRSLEPGGSGDLAWAEFTRRLRAYAVRKGLAASEAEDLVQEVLLKGFLQRSSVQRGRLVAWLYTTARRALVDHHRKDARRARRVAGAAVVEELAEEGAVEPSALAELAGCLAPLLSELEPEDRAILRRVELDGASQVELARELDLPFSTLKSRVQRARRRLRERYERCCALELDGRGFPLGCEPRSGGPRSSCT